MHVLAFSAAELLLSLWGYWVQAVFNLDIDYSDDDALLDWEQYAGECATGWTAGRSHIFCLCMRGVMHA